MYFTYCPQQKGANFYTPEIEREIDIERKTGKETQRETERDKQREREIKRKTKREKEIHIIESWYLYQMVTPNTIRTY